VEAVLLVEVEGGVAVGPDNFPSPQKERARVRSVGRIE